MRQYDNVQNLLFHLTDSIPQTVNLIGNTILSFHKNPQEFKKLKEDSTKIQTLNNE
jgi:cell shape-determining protein MreC